MQWYCRKHSRKPTAHASVRKRMASLSCNQKRLLVPRAAYPQVDLNPRVVVEVPKREANGYKSTLGKSINGTHREAYPKPGKETQKATLKGGPAITAAFGGTLRDPCI